MMILDKIDFSCEEALNPKNKQFTPNHTIFDCKITYNKKNYKFEYQCNTKYEMPTLERVMECLMLDMEAYDSYFSYDMSEFAKDYGYKTIAEARSVYNACRKSSNGLHRLFTDTELTEISDDLYYCAE